MSHQCAGEIKSLKTRIPANVYAGSSLFLVSGQFRPVLKIPILPNPVKYAVRY
jgi:hypothetical protein